MSESCNKSCTKSCREYIFLCLETYLGYIYTTFIRFCGATNVFISYAFFLGVNVDRSLRSPSLAGSAAGGGECSLGGSRQVQRSLPLHIPGEFDDCGDDDVTGAICCNKHDEDVGTSISVSTRPSALGMSDPVMES